MSEITRRKNIITKFKSYRGRPKKGITNRIAYLKIISKVGLFLYLFLVSIVIYSIINRALKINTINMFKWENIHFFIIFSLIFMFNTPNVFYELSLLKHLQRIDFLKLKNIQDLNSKLEIIISRINSRAYRITISLIILIFCAVAVINSKYDNNVFWSYMIYLTPILYCLMILRFFNNYKKLTENINETEECN